MNGAVGDTLRKALGAPRNAPAELLRLVFPGCDPKPSGDGSGVMCDPRGGEHAEHNPSFTFWHGEQDGGAMFSRKGTGETWNAVQLLKQYGNGGAGMVGKEAAALLITRAGMVDTPSQFSALRSRSVSMPRLSSKLRKRQEGAIPVNADVALSAWEPLKRWPPGNQEPGEAWKALEARGLLPALSLGLLEAFRVCRKGRGVSKLLTADALAFKVRPPGWASVAAVKFRNAGSAEQLKETGRERYMYFKGHKGTPAHTSPGLLSPEMSAEVWTEGELNGVAFMLALQSRNLLGRVGVQGMAGAGGNPHILHDLKGRRVYIYTDPDKAGQEAQTRWARLALEVGAVPYMLPPFIEGDAGADAADFLGRLWVSGTLDVETKGAVALGEWLAGNMSRAIPWQDPESPTETSPEYGEGFQSWPYAIQGGQVGKLKRVSQGAEDACEFRPLLGFTARIVADVVRDSGDGHPLHVFTIEGRTPEGRVLPAVDVVSGKFGSMAWALESWGADGFVYPGPSVIHEARAALLSLSRAAGIERRTIHTRTGWVDLPGHGPVFLTAGECIGASGAVPGVGVSLLGKLQHYALPIPPEGDAEVRAVREALELLKLAPASLMFPLLGMVFRAPLGAVRFAGWLESQTGWGKSTLAQVLMGFYGKGWVAHFPPADFQSTDNALALSAFTAQDVLLTADDFKPEGTPSVIAAEYTKASKFLSSAGNGSGRDRMTADALSVREGYYPRGLVLATAESGPRKHSDVARTVVLTVPGPLFGPGGPADGSARFNEARLNAEAGTYALVMSGFLRWVAQHHTEVMGASLAGRVQVSARDFPGAHGRTANNAAELFEGWRTFLTYARDCGALTEDQARDLGEQAMASLRETSDSQAAALKDVDPTSRFFPLLSELLDSGAVYLEDAVTGEAPGAELGADAPYAQGAGWRWRVFGNGEGQWEHRPSAVSIGYLGEFSGTTYALLKRLTYALVNKAAEGEGHSLPAPKVLWRNLRGQHGPSGAMYAPSGDRALYPRRVHGCGPRERKAFYNFRWPLPSESWDTRDTSGEMSSNTANIGVPFYFLETKHISRNGTRSGDFSSETTKIGVPILSSAETFHQDARDPEERDGFEVFTV